MSQLHPGVSLDKDGRVPRGPGKLKREPLLKACENAGYDAQTAIIEIAKGELHCLTCFGETRTWYAIVHPETHEVMRDENGEIRWVLRKCESCAGTGRERMHVSEVLKARIAILDKLVPSLKQVDHTSQDGSHITRKWIMEVVGGPKVALNGTAAPQLQQKND